MNQFHGPNPAVFSTSPGTVVASVADPLATDALYSIGPLARRLLLVTEAVVANRGSIALADLVAQLVAPEFDAAVTSPGVTHAEEIPPLRLIARPPVERSIEVRDGTATAQAYQR